MLRAGFVSTFIAIGAALAAAPARADGPVGYRPGAQASNSLPEVGAIEAYNRGYDAIRHADEVAASSEDRAAIESAYGQALEEFATAVKVDASMHEAHTYIGYANRKLGRFDASLAAYATALRINPDYPHAIEYQGQAYLGLNRPQDAKFNYLRLYAIAPGQAAKLLSAMKAWAQTHRQDTALAGQAEQLALWIAGLPVAQRDAEATTSAW